VTEVLFIAISLGLVAACGLFVAAEFAFVTVDRPTVERGAEEGDAKAKGVLAALRSLSTQLSGAQVGITLTNLLIGFLAEPAIARLIDSPLESAGVPSAAVTGVSIVIALTLATGITMVFGELVPKNLAITHPYAVSRAVQRPMRLFTTVSGPVITAMNNTANRILLRLGIEPQEELASARSAQELASLVRRSAKEGTLELSTATLLERSLIFGERTASDVMTPRPRMRVLPRDASAMAVVEAARQTGYSRFPVTGATPDEIVGVVHVKQAVSVPLDARASTPIDTIMAPPALVPSSVGLDRLLELLREGGLQIAIVVDEFGDVDGVVTLEDVVEEIVGEVVDEHDRPDPRVRRVPTGDWVLSGLLRPDEAGRAVGLALPEGEEYETIAGLLAERLERMPAIGDHVEFEVVDLDRRPHRVRLTVSRMDGLRVDRVLLHSEPLPHEDDDDDD
jgi:CBS domain containing-hemolysin-like protein